MNIHWFVSLLVKGAGIAGGLAALVAVFTALVELGAAAAAQRSLDATNRLLADPAAREAFGDSLGRRQRLATGRLAAAQLMGGWGTAGIVTRLTLLTLVVPWALFPSEGRTGFALQIIWTLVSVFLGVGAAGRAIQWFFMRESIVRAVTGDDERAISGDELARFHRGNKAHVAYGDEQVQFFKDRGSTVLAGLAWTAALLYPRFLLARYFPAYPMPGSLPALARPAALLTYIGVLVMVGQAWWFVKAYRTTVTGPALALPWSPRREWREVPEPPPGHERPEEPGASAVSAAPLDQSPPNGALRRRRPRLPQIARAGVLMASWWCSGVGVKWLLARTRRSR